MFRVSLPRILAIAAMLTLGGIALFHAHPAVVFAQTSTALSDVGAQTGLGGEDPRLIVARIIRTGLTLLGVLAVLLVLYAGFTWMTAGGNEEKILRAKKILIRGAIGLAIILLSWAITSFVISALVSAVNGDGTIDEPPVPPLCIGCRTSNFTVTDYSPDGAVPIRNVQLRVTFSKDVDSATLPGNVVVTNTATGAVVDGVLAASGNYATFTPSAVCPSPNEDRFCFDADTAFAVTVSNAIRSSTGTILSCGTDRCTSSFSTGSLVDTQNPTAEITDPEQYDAIPTASVQGIQVYATDDSQVAGGAFALDDITFESIGATGDDLTHVTIETVMDTTSLTNGTYYRITATVTDIAGNTDDDFISVIARPASCFNEQLDADLGETGVDCGGDATSALYCGACDGSACTDDSQCASGSCVDGFCTTLPEITEISPGDGAVGTYVTITGTGFGGLAGTVFFPTLGGLIAATMPSCSDGWSPTYVVVEVPVGAVDGPITLVTNDGLTETTSDTQGPLIPDFDVNSVVHPKLCILLPSTGAATDAVTLKGFDFGDLRGDSTVTFDTTAAGSYTSWAAEATAVTVPSVADGDYGVAVTVNGVSSNALPFAVAAPDLDVPMISGINPSSGPVGTYLTITGTHFGGAIGTVWLEDTATGYLALASTDFPAACADNFWSDDAITVIVPSTFQNKGVVTPGAYSVFVTTSFGDDSNSVPFTVDTSALTPGICAITPSTGAVGDSVTVYGARLGSTGTVTFYNGVTTTAKTAADWTSSAATVAVPSGAVTGPVSVTTSSLESNTINFSVGTTTATTTEKVAPASYGWYFSTGEIPETPEFVVECSDTRVSGVPNSLFTDAVCTNAIVYGEFSTLMDKGSVADAVYVAACTAGGDKPCSATTPVEGGVEVLDTATATYFRFVPTAAWTTSTMYQVTIDDTATSAVNIPLSAAVSWEFSTSESDADCAVNAVYMSPTSATITVKDGTTAYHALPVSGCVVTNADDYLWSWDVDSSYAKLGASADGTCNGGTTSCATVVGLAEGVSEVTATETVSAKTGSGDLIVNFTDPYVDNYAPNCDDACREAQLYATFNTSMLRSSVLADGAVTLYTCANELCSSLEEFSKYTVSCVSQDAADPDACDEVDIVLGADLSLGTYYRVVISGDVQSASGVPLTRTNYQGDFSWTFKVKTDATACGADRLSVSPQTAVASTIGERQTFDVSAYGAPDACSEAGQKLETTGYNWSWTTPIADSGKSKDIDVAEWWANASVDTNLDGIAKGCTTACTAVGSMSYSAICGDGVVDVGEECEDGNTLSGDGCSSICLNEGSAACTTTCGVAIAISAFDSSSGASCTTDADCPAEETCGYFGAGCCGNGKLDGVTFAGGEECDDSNARDGDGCSSACLNEGSQEIQSTCGNGDLAYDPALGGEDCDDGNLDRGDGCDAQCLSEGAPTLSAVGGAICGNGVIDTPYENCDTTLTPEGCSDTCLLEGASVRYTTPSVCGDTVMGIGEACDDGNTQDGDGCSAECLVEGSSTTYTIPSFCGDGAVGTGELAICEVGSGDRNVDALQLALIAEDAAEEVDDVTHDAVATIVVTEPTSALFTTADWTLSCSAATDQNCTDPVTYGVGTANCCMPRPTAELSPVDRSTNVCRNAQLYGTFTEEMNTASFMVKNDDATTTPKMYAKLDISSTGVCPSSHTTLAMAPRNVFARAWVAARRLVLGIPAGAASGDCVVPVVGYDESANNDGTYTVRMRYGAPLEPNAQYALVLATDPSNTDGTAEGVLSQGGVGVFNGLNVDTQSVSFTTGDALCALDALSVADSDSVSPNYFTQTNEAHAFTATAYSYDSGTPQAIEPIASFYSWEITSWSDDEGGAVVAETQSLTDPTMATVTAVGDNGTANVLATATIRKDTVNGTEGTTVTGTTPVTAYLCENPWPTLADFPWEDADMHFSLSYCRDAGTDNDTSDDYPAVSVVQAAPRVSVKNDTVLREYLYEVPGSTDAIGVRIVTNDDYLSPMAWYEAQGFTGSPTETTVDGFAAVTDGRTTYVAAPNDTGAGVYANIYVISYNEGASETTIEIYNQMFASMQFATNLSTVKLCYAFGKGVTTTTCTSDLDCTIGANEYCLADKSKLQRDTQRLADLTTVAAAVAAYGADNGVCSATVDQSCSSNADCPTSETCTAVVPNLSSGTYVRSLGASTWTSWGDVLGAAVDLPSTVVDPVNAYYGCGTGDLASYDAATCVNATAGTYICPDHSFAYHYRAVGSQSIELFADLEYTGGAWVNTLDDDTTDAVTYYAAGSAVDPTVAGFTNDMFCETSSTYGSDGVCGDGVINMHADGTRELCEIGDRGGTSSTCDSDGDGVNDGTREQTCASTCASWTDDTAATCVPASCGNAVLDAGEDCDDGNFNGRYGYCGADCKDASRYYCGDGKLSGGEFCDCGAPSLSAVPTDARPSGGVPGTCAGVNGTYSNNPGLTCAWDCLGTAAYCGDATIDEDQGETCDSDTVTWSGKLCKSKGRMATLRYTACEADSDCTGSNQQCGDDTPDAYDSSFDECPTTTVCVVGDVGAICTKDANCDTTRGSGDGICSSTVYETTRTADCANDGASGGTCTSSASWQSTSCRAVGSCGDGVVDAGEECDDGNTTATDSCTAECKQNVCGDGALYEGEEQCDEGADNGQGCDANYESSCTACSLTCTYEVSSGDFCGDGMINGDEYCDAYAMPYYYYSATADAVYGTCSTLGAPYTDSRTGTRYTCTDLGVCDGGAQNGGYCTSDTSCGTGGDCVFPSCTDSCASSCPFTYDATSLLVTSNQPGAAAASLVDLYTYSTSTTSDVPNAATVTIPACDAISSITADISMDNVTPPQTFVLFVTDLSGSMDYAVGYDSVPMSGEDTRLEIVQDGLSAAVSSIYDSLGSNVQIGAVGYKGVLAGECYISGASCTSDANCASYSGDYCSTETTATETFPFTLASSEDDIQSEILGYFADNAANGTLTYDGLAAAKDMMDDAARTYGTSNTRYVVILLTDGVWSSGSSSSWRLHDPKSIATSMKSAGYEIYTASITDDSDFIDEVAGWSSGNPNAENGIDYAYNAQTSDALQSLFDEMLSSLLDITVTIISADNADADTDAESDTSMVRDGSNVALPWPTGFACDPNNEQELPIRLTFQGEGKIEVSNVQVNYCAP